jgi:Ca2+-binding RTX toxin-like protein
MLALGMIPTYNSSNQITSVTPVAAGIPNQAQNVANFLYDTLNPSNTLGSGGGTAQSYISAWSSSNVTASYNTIISQLDAYLIPQGYYIVQSSDSSSSIIDTLAAGGMTVSGLTATALLRINAPFGVTGIDTGALLHVPTSEISLSSTPTALSTLFGNETYVVDPASNAAYVVGGLTDGSPSGALVIDNDSNDGIYTTFAQGTFAGASVSGGYASVNLATPAGFVLGTYDTDPSLTLPDGTVITLSPTPGFDLTDSLSSTATPEEVLLSYLSQLGDTTTASALDTANFNYLNPTGSSYTVTGSVSGSTDTFTDEGGAPDAHITGVSGDTNILYASGDLAQDTISGIQTLDVEGSIALTGAEYDGFTTIASSYTITIDSSGMYSLGASADALTAGDWGGTELIGNSSFNILTASLFGNDTLDAGNGTGDELVAGEGVDALNGGSGGDLFEADNGLASGSSITGEGTGNTLQANGDISGATISDVQTLDIEPASGGGEGSVTLTASQLAGFSTINADGGYTIIAAGGGTYDVSGDTVPYAFDLDADATDDTALIGNGTDDQTLSATGSSGNDTLTAGSGYADILDASGSTGNDTLIGGSNFDIMYSGNGVDTMKGGTGVDDFILAAGVAAGTTITGGTGTGSNEVDTYASDLTGVGIANVQTLDDECSSLTLTASQFSEFSALVNASGTTETLIVVGNGTYSLTGKDVLGSFTVETTPNIITGDSTAAQSLYADTSGDDVVVAGNGAGDSLYAGDGNDTLIAGTGGDALYAGSGTDTLTGGSGGDFLQAGTGLDYMYGGSAANWFGVYNSLASGDVLNGGSGDDSELQTGGGADVNIAAATISNFVGLDVDAEITLTASQLSEFSYIGSDDSSGTIQAATTGTYDLSGDTVAQPMTLIAAASGGSTLIAGGNTETLVTSAAGGDTIYGASGDTVDVTADGTTDNYIIMSDGTVNFADNARADVYGSDDTINVGNDDIAGSEGNIDSVTASGSGDSIYLFGTSGDTDNISITGSGGDDVIYDSNTDNTINLSGDGAGGTDNYIVMSGQTVNLDDNARADTYGTGNTINAGTDDTVGSDGGNTITATGSGDAIYLFGTGSDTASMEASGDTAYVTTSDGNDLVYASSGDTVNVSGNGSGGTDNYIVMSGGNVNFANNARADTYGDDDTITAGNDDTVGVYGTSDTVSLGSSSSVWMSGTSESVTINGGGSNSYQFGSTFGQDIINNAASGSATTANGQVGFTSSSTTDEKLWFQMSGSNLVVTLLGTDDTITIDNWSSGGAKQVSEFAADGLTTDPQSSQFGALVSAMAYYSSTTDPGFNPATSGATMPSTLTSDLAAAWT